MAEFIPAAALRTVLLSIFCLSSSGPPEDLLSFPTRRSSDLVGAHARRWHILPYHALRDSDSPLERSEEHTSELQSRQYLVCRPLLEKTKLRNSTRNNTKNGLIRRRNIRPLSGRVNTSITNTY